MNESLNIEIMNRLVQGKSLDGLALGTRDGRLDLSGLTLATPQVIRRFRFDGIPITKIEPGAVIQSARWSNLDFTRSKLNSLRLLGGNLINCRFDWCQLEDLRVWSTSFSGCSFRGANLKRAALGGVQEGKRNTYSEVDFSEADLRETVYEATAFERCLFRNSRIEKVDFQTSTFRECVFEGDLRDVLFWRCGFRGELFPPNEMLNVDFSSAKLHYVGFRGLTLDRVKLPSDSEHIMIKNVTATLDRLIEALNKQGDATAKKLIAFLNIGRKWLAPNQVQKVINIHDLAETVGDEGVSRLHELLGGQ